MSQIATNQGIQAKQTFGRDKNGDQITVLMDDSAAIDRLGIDRWPEGADGSRHPYEGANFRLLFRHWECLKVTRFGQSDDTMCGSVLSVITTSANGDGARLKHPI